ncbi:hypothetical protein FNH05_15005 [Amycolatopsis rhizosphaerae]|uniref:DUF2231 domain-containing protein n=1 Tax=Amycolatopsis rhizosphaerae TaxID=2053003 RepID=A0A558CRL2_9PSEU|nr:DUF2231 domain-containing protein [Amycolatopsis rhizosphaerae]TVT51397.1 hypothetical protein FNH05_15005 [Amycolatopsis rhizosphaerae]
MPFLISGVPLHVLAVHAVVVLVPLAVLTTVIIAVWPAARRRFGWAVAGLTLLATACIPIATESGEDLRDRLTSTDLIRTHAHLGDQLLVFVAGLLVVTVALMWFDRRNTKAAAAKAAAGDTENGTGGTATATAATATKPMKAVVPVLSVLVVALAVASAVQVVRIGDSGAKAAWSGTQYTAPQHPEGEGDGD